MEHDPEDCDPCISVLCAYALIGDEHEDSCPVKPVDSVGYQGIEFLAPALWDHTKPETPLKE